MQGYAQEICRTRFFVGLRIEVDAPGVLAAIRPCSESAVDLEQMDLKQKILQHSWAHGYWIILIYLLAVQL